jgi:hypothetical protein
VACNTPTISAGTHSFDLFFVDINTTQSGLTFSITSQGVTTSAPPTGAPEIDPGSAASGLMLLLGGLAVLRRRAPAPAAMTGSSG